MVLFLVLGVPRPSANGPAPSSAVRWMMEAGLVNSKDGLLCSSIPNGTLVQIIIWEVKTTADGERGRKD